jgi:radical SAM superfamily enzyme YgiQ (UPF0313 family)
VGIAPSPGGGFTFFTPHEHTRDERREGEREEEKRERREEKRRDA